jgi:hypothetical protein
VYQTVTKQLLDDYKDNMDVVALNLSEKMTSLESAVSEKNKALCCIIYVEPYQETLLRDKKTFNKIEWIQQEECDPKF